MANRRSIDNPYGSSRLGADTSLKASPRYSQELSSDTDAEKNGVGPGPTPPQSPPEMLPDVQESPRDLEEGPIQTVPDIRTSPDDPQEHMERERRKASDKAYKALEEAYDLDQMGSDQRAIFEDFVGSAMSEGRSLEEIMVALDHPDAASYIGISRRQPEPTSLERLRINAAEHATQEAERKSEQEKRARYLQAQESIMADPNLNSDGKAGALEDASRKIYGTPFPPR